MNAAELAFESLADVAAIIRARDLSPVGLVAASLARIEALDPALNSFITVTAEAALAEAETAEAEIRAGKYRGPLHGIPVAVKDLYATAGVRTSFTCAAYAEWVPDHDAAAVERLRDAGAILVGKTNLHELAGGSSNATSHFGAAHNPWNRDYITGGSSGGSAAAVAAGPVTGRSGATPRCPSASPPRCAGSGRWGQFSHCDIRRIAVRSRESSVSGFTSRR